MFKVNELKQPSSCLNKAKDDEMIFVLRGHDPAAPMVIRAWCEARILIGKNQRDDGQIFEALQCAEIMEQTRDKG
jgi:hypothetical protein